MLAAFLDVNSAPIYVAALGVITAVGGSFLAYKGNRRASDVTFASNAADVLSKERKQLALEWHDLREYTMQQLKQCREENDALSAKVDTQEKEIATLRSEVVDLRLRLKEHGG